MKGIVFGDMAQCVADEEQDYLERGDSACAAGLQRADCGLGCAAGMFMGPTSRFRWAFRLNLTLQIRRIRGWTLLKRLFRSSL